MELGILVGLLVLNFAISWWDAKMAGRVWLETQVQGGFLRLVAWCAAVQSAVGFTMVFAVLLGLAATAMHLLSLRALTAMLDLTYLLLIVPLLGSGLVISLQSYIVAYRERCLLSMGTATWNTYAMTYDTLGAVDSIGEAFSDLCKSLHSDDSDAENISVAIVVTLTAMALGSGILLTYVIARSSLHGLRRPQSRPSHPTVGFRRHGGRIG